MASISDLNMIIECQSYIFINHCEAYMIWLWPTHGYKCGTTSYLCCDGDFKRESNWACCCCFIAFVKNDLEITWPTSTFLIFFQIYKLGFLVDFLSHAATVGFVVGAAIVIGLQQLKGLLRISHFTNKTNIISVVEAIWRSIHHHVCSFSIFSFYFIFCWGFWKAYIHKAQRVKEIW